jgi:hypothetical protein
MKTAMKTPGRDDVPERVVAAIMRDVRALDSRRPPARARLEAELGAELTRRLVTALTPTSRPRS